MPDIIGKALNDELPADIRKYAELFKMDVASFELFELFVMRVYIQGKNDGVREAINTLREIR